MLGADDLPPFVVSNEAGVSPFLLLGDHAGRAIPRRLGDLGLPPGAMARHIAWDIGISALGALLSRALDACFIEQTYSRLVIDCNRWPEAADAMPAESDGQVVPGNRDLTAEDRAARRDEIMAPYQARIARLIDARTARGQPTLLVSLHSFTPVMRGQARPWRYGVLHLPGSDLSQAALTWLRDRFDPAMVGDNEPYALDDQEQTIPRHAEPNGLDYLELEVRQDLLADSAGQAEVAAVVARLLADLAPAAGSGA